MKVTTSILTAITIILSFQNILYSNPNLITNGDFSSGNSGFYSPYNYCNSSGCIGICGCPFIYAIGADPSFYSNWTGHDHTTGSGNLMIVDGALNQSTIWRETVPVLANTNYSISFWLANMNGLTPANIQVVINGTNVGSSLTAPSNTNVWVSSNSIWNSGVSTSATIDLIDLQTAFVGNDFGLDDISFTQNCNSINTYICEVIPNLNAIDAEKTSDISVTFSQDMNASSINNSNIKVFGLQTGLLSTSVSYNAGTKTAAINPNSDFKTGEKIQVTLSSGIQTSTNTPITPFVWTFTVQALSGTGIFTEAYVVDSVNVDLSPSGELLKCADVDGDGDIDLIAENYYSSCIKIFKNNGTGLFSDAQTISNIPNVHWYSALNMADYDNDGDIDMSFSTATPIYLTDSFYVYKNDGTGNFSRFSAMAGGGLIAADADLDGDGDIDLAESWGFDNVRYFINDGNGNFTMHQIGGLGYYHTNGCDAGDIDNDGDMDILVSLKDFSGSNCKVVMLMNDGNANFSIGNTYLTENYFSNQRFADLNGDNCIDFAGWNYLYFNLCNSNFSQTSFAAGSEAVPFDFDGDGDLDLSYTTGQFGGPNDQVKSYKNNGAGSFSNFSNITAGHDVNSVASGDFDNDGDIDMAADNSLGHSGNQSDISILMNDYPQIITGNIKAAIEGFLNTGTNEHNVRDTLSAFLRNAIAPFSLIDSAKAVIDSATFTGSFSFNNAQTGKYYLVVKHRNALETWSKLPSELITGGSTFNYDFTTSASKAYGNNLIHKGSKYCIYSGDADQDGAIDLDDIVLIYNNVSNFAFGYANADLTGDNAVDLSDLLIAYNNSSKLVSVKRP